MEQRGFRMIIFALLFFPFYTLLSGSLSLSRMYVTSIGTRSLFALTDWSITMD